MGFETISNENQLKNKENMFIQRKKKKKKIKIILFYFKNYIYNYWDINNIYI